MNTVISASHLHKCYRSFVALDDVSFTVAPGRIVGLIGPNGAGKTTAINAILGLADIHGELSVLGLNPRTDRRLLMEQVCFIADVALLPEWLKVRDALDFMEGVHPRFSRAKAEGFLEKTTIGKHSYVGCLSKGMITQLHLALIMAVDAKLLVLDEPTLGLDVLYRKQFYDALLSDYCDGNRTILITTHELSEIENVLTDLLFIDRGRIVLDCAIEDVEQRFVELETAPDLVSTAQELRPLVHRQSLGRNTFIFEDVPRERLRQLGELRTPALSDLFVAKVSSTRKAA